MKKSKESNAITLVALVITIVILLILAGITIAQLSGNGIFDKAKTAKQESQNAQDDENDKIAKYENEINSYVNGNRDTVTIPSSEYENLKNAITGLKLNLINTGSTSVAYNTSKTIYKKTFSEGKLITFSSYAQSSSGVNATYGIFVILNGNIINTNMSVEESAYHGVELPNVSNTMYVEKNDILEIQLYQAKNSQEAITLNYSIYGNMGDSDAFN